MSQQFYFKQISLSEVHSFNVKNSSISNYSVGSLNIKTVLFQAIQFSISTQFSSIWGIDGTQSGANTPGKSRPGSDGNEGVLRIPQGSDIIGNTPSDF